MVKKKVGNHFETVIILLSVMVSVLFISSCNVDVNDSDNYPKHEIYIYSNEECENKDNFKDECYYEAAKKEQNIIICEKAGKLQKTCKAEIIMNKDSFQSCGEIEEAEIRDICFSYLAVDFPNYESYDITFCSEIQKAYTRDSCYSDVSKELKDVSGCEEIQDEKIKDECYFMVSLEEINSAHCEKIIDEESRDYCSYSVKELESLDEQN